MVFEIFFLFYPPPLFHFFSLLHHPGVDARQYYYMYYWSARFRRTSRVCSRASRVCSSILLQPLCPCRGVDAVWGHLRHNPLAAPSDGPAIIAPAAIIEEEHLVVPVHDAVVRAGALWMVRIVSRLSFNHLKRKGKGKGNGNGNGKGKGGGRARKRGAFRAQILMKGVTKGWPTLCTLTQCLLPFSRQESVWQLCWRRGEGTVQSGGVVVLQPLRRNGLLIGSVHRTSRCRSISTAPHRST